jgi:hypothetical protein
VCYHYEPNGFVYVATYSPQSITQFKATVKTACAGGSTVDLKLTAVRELMGIAGWAQLSAIAVLSPSTLLLSHYDRTLQVLTHTAPTSSGAADSKLAGPVGALRPLTEAEAGYYATGRSHDRRCSHRRTRAAAPHQ